MQTAAGVYGAKVEPLNHRRGGAKLQLYYRTFAMDHGKLDQFCVGHAHPLVMCDDYVVTIT